MINNIWNLKILMHTTNTLRVTNHFHSVVILEEQYPYNFPLEVVLE